MGGGREYVKTCKTPELMSCIKPQNKVRSTIKGVEGEERPQDNSLGWQKGEARRVAQESSIIGVIRIQENMGL